MISTLNHKVFAYFKFVINWISIATCKFSPNAVYALRKHAYSNILKILQPKKENFPIKNPIFFYITSLNIDCGYSLEPHQRGGSNEYPQSMFFNKIRKIMYTPVNPSFTI